MFDYGDIPEKDPHFKECLEKEFFERSQYEKFVKVKEGDIVVDIGASIGPFIYSIKDRKSLKIIAVEPMSTYHDLLLKNSFSNSVLEFTLYKNAIGSVDNEILDLEWSSEREQVKTISFQTLIKENNLDHINFLKLDCEGGEYSIFTEDNLDYLKNNVDYIVGEFHLNDQQMTESFKKMYKLLIKHNFNLHIESVDGVDNTQWFRDDLEYISNKKAQVIIYIDNRKSKKLLYVAPHLSTGGLPQYLTKKVELLKQDFEIHLVEWVDHTGGRLVVTKNKLVKLIDSDKFYTLKENKFELLDIVNKVKPDIIHLEEIPEFFMDNEVAQKLYNPNRDYYIVETSHDSSFNPDNKRFFPDKFMFVSNWQIQQYKDLDIPKVLVEYPIEYVERPDRDEALRKLHLNPHKKHILHIGLFTPRKNQSEFFEYARALPEYEFHCVGNQADNFKHYWEPLMKDKPDNLTWWDERTDVDKFYQAMDLFLFTSRGTANDKETMPLVIREAISYQIPILIYNLPVYLNYFDKFDTIGYLEFDNFGKNCELIKLQLEDKSVVQHSDEVFVISTYPSTDSVVDTTLDCVKAVQKHGYKVILTSHIPIPEVLQKQADYCIVDKNNVLTKHTFYTNFYWNSDQCSVNLNLRGEGNDVYHGPAVYTNYYNGAALATQLEFKKAYFLNYDYILKDVEGIENISNILNRKDFYFGKHHPSEGDALYTYFFAAKPYFLTVWLESISTGKEYDQLMETYGAESNGLENLFHHILKDGGSIYREEEPVFESKTKEIFDHRDFSRVEYFTILSTNVPNHFSPYFYISNSKDSRTIYYKVYKDSELIIERVLNIDQKCSFWDLLKFDGKYEVKFEIQDEYSTETKIFKIDQEYFDNLSQNGILKLKEK